MYKSITLESSNKIVIENRLNCCNLRYPTKNFHKLNVLFPTVSVVRTKFKFQFKSVWNKISIAIRHSNSLKVTEKKLLNF